MIGHLLCLVLESNDNILDLEVIDYVCSKKENKVCLNENVNGIYPLF